MRIKELAGLPIEQHDSPNKGGTMTGHKGLVLHIAEGTYRGTISWQMNPDQRYASGKTVTTSSTFIVGRNRGEWAQMVDSDRIAWCQRDGSLDWNSIELAGYAPNPPTAWQIEACAQLLAWHHRTYGTPLQATSSTGTRGLGHHSMDNDTTVEWGHDSCPGAGVIAAKSAIVARAKEIINGKVEDDMSTEAEAQIAAIHAQVTGRGADAAYALVVGPGGSTAWVAQTLKAHGDKLDALAAAVATPPSVEVDYDKLADALFRRAISAAGADATGGVV